MPPFYQHRPRHLWPFSTGAPSFVHLSEEPLPRFIMSECLRCLLPSPDSAPARRISQKIIPPRLPTSATSLVPPAVSYLHTQVVNRSGRTLAVSRNIHAASGRFLPMPLI